MTWWAKWSCRRSRSSIDPDNTLTDSDSLAKEVERIRSQGFAFDNEEAEKGVSCIGAGIFNDEGRIVAGLSVSAPSDRLNKDWAQSIRQTAEKTPDGRRVLIHPANAVAMAQKQAGQRPGA